MKIALIGYGKMGKMLETTAIGRGHEIVSIIDADNTDDFDSEAFRSAEVALEFTTPQTAVDNIKRSWAADVKVVCGTTGWTSEALPQLTKAIETNGKTLFWASNFSLGVNIFWELNKAIARLLGNFDQYSVSIEEIHHTQKKDAPSGTAVTLAEAITDNMDRLHGWTLLPCKEAGKIPIEAIRRDDVCGIHTVRYESEEDVITFSHEAKSRRGFALGAVVAAEFLAERTGLYTMKDLLEFA